MANPVSPEQHTPHTEHATCCDSGSCCAATASETRESPADAPLPPGATRHSWQVSGMDCAACARKVENAVRSVPGVSQVQVLFATEKLLVTGQGDLCAAVEQAVTRAGYQLLSSRPAGTPPVAEAGFWQENRTILILAAMMIISQIIAWAAPAAGNIAFIVTTLTGLWPIARQAWRLIRSGSWFAIETLMTVAAAGALVIGATHEAAMVLLLFLLGERLEGWAASRARKGVTALMALRPEVATRVEGDQRTTVALADLHPGDVIEVSAGGRLPADGILLNGPASFDESAITGESVPVEHQNGDPVSAGCTSVDRLVSLRVTSRPGESAIDRILRMIEEADSRRAPIERFIDRFSRVYTPAIMALALLVAVIPPLLMGQLWEPWIYKGLTLLLIGCPCALVISTPAAITSGLAAASRRGALLKGGVALERLRQVQQMAFDKTGTLTRGQPRVSAIVTHGTLSEAQLLALAASAEQGTSHPLGQAIMREAQARGLEVSRATSQTTRAGVGIEAVINGQNITLCAPARAPREALSGDWPREIATLESGGQTVIVALADNQLQGIIGLSDTLREDARQAIAQLKALGIEGIMLTGDNPRAAAAIAGELGIEFRAGLLPEDKVTAVRALNQQAPLAMVGDGINDAPAMKTATIGIAMGSGSDVALETADAALTRNSLAELPALIRLARATHSNIRQNIGVALGLKALFLVTTLLGVTGLWMAVLADSGATALVTANALRLLRRGKN
ncbi:zinc/cadmium/mercury/lead-transporting ATPase [Shimwellia blattae]|nr:zinc/cadmium/mercury/lead-transporting ATPase [Shimwellia blattae]GAB80574.1 lead/cadmium/zinc-transporting P-type ATPase ZntA [Shimwellia blattae DSM 4481 = NBRC 105725]VDY62794.1 Lead, cadmium, zinc and mercury-transporting ATPase [Shimwellia blattae]VEC19645.1 Lead, cadmium, zinc and mercury-transporting ATPase [Shimwellia blattae]